MAKCGKGQVDRNGVCIDWQPFKQESLPKELGEAECFHNNLYQVMKRELKNGVTWLSIKSKDKEPIRDWRDLQRIKNEITSPGREGVELFPSEERLVDSSNQYHIWVLPDGQQFPFGYEERNIVRGHSKGSKQREFGGKHPAPPDALTLKKRLKTPFKQSVRGLK
jgi:hypothetical protein